jgi:sugar O-acyltransferase (sialic acid O-acetyltransferase NeuD family)
LIVGTSGLAKEVAQLARKIDPQARRWPEIAYVCQDPTQLGLQLPFGSVRHMDADLLELDRQTDVVLGVGHPDARQAIARRLRGNQRLGFPNLVHPSVEIDPALVTIGVGNLITQGVVMTCDISIGNFNLLNWNVTIGHDTNIGCYNVINPGCSISGRVRVADACLFGTGCRVLEELSIVSDVTIGAGAVVTRSIEQAGTYLGMPARRAGA